MHGFMVRSWSDHGLTHVFSQVRPSISDTDSQNCSTAAFSKGVIIGTHSLVSQDSTKQLYFLRMFTVTHADI